MLLIAFLLAGTLEVRGDLKLVLDAAVHPTRDSGAVLELSYDIPFTSLAFLREANSFAARFSIGVQVLDRRGDPLAGDMWHKSVEVAEYETTVARDSSVLGTVSLDVPEGASKARVEVADLGSDRRTSAGFNLEQPGSGLLIRFLKNGRPNLARTYGLEDTLEVLAEVLAMDAQVDSLRFQVKEGRRIVTGGTSPVTDSSGLRAARFRYPLADSSGMARLAGQYRLEVIGLGKDDLQTGVDFRVKVPFFYDDAAYLQKVDELLYIASSKEMTELKKAPTQEREQAWHRFWKERDPTPTTEQNEKEEEYFERIEYAKEHFSHGDKGYKSDRARVYVRYGPADHIDSRPFEIDSHAYEIWYYYSLGLEFRFVDRYGFGQYVRDNPRFWNE